MTVQFNPNEKMHDEFNYYNSRKAIERFPFPFPEDQYMYSVNIEPATSRPGTIFEHWFDIDEHYVTEMNERRLTLEQDPKRCIIMPHMLQASWDFLAMVMERYATDYPEHFQLNKQGNEWHWINQPLNIDQQFVFGDTA